MTTCRHHVIPLMVAGTFFSRLAGMMLKRCFPSNAGLLLTRTASIHTFFMRMAIDVVYVDASGAITGVVQGLPPWRFHVGPRRTAHTIELPVGTVTGLGLADGDRLALPLRGQHLSRQRGASIVEFVIVAPLISLMGLGIIQYGMLFFTKNSVNHATFMAARAGANEHANMDKVRDAYLGAISASYATGRSAGDLLNARAAAESDLAGALRIELLNPTKESFDDWNDPDAQARHGTGSARVIPNSGLAFKPVSIGPTSGQSLQDANLIKLRVTHGFKPRIPMIAGVYTKMLGWLDNGSDGFHTALVNEGRIPIVAHVTLHMNSDAIESGSSVSIPGQGNKGSPVNPGDPPVSTRPPPTCVTAGCTVGNDPVPPKCDPSSDPNGCRPPQCQPGDQACDPACGVTMCCAPK